MLHNFVMVRPMFTNLVSNDARYFKAKRHETVRWDLCALKHYCENSRDGGGGGGGHDGPPPSLYKYKNNQHIVNTAKKAGIFSPCSAVPCDEWVEDAFCYRKIFGLHELQDLGSSLDVSLKTVGTDQPLVCDLRVGSRNIW